MVASTTAPIPPSPNSVPPPEAPTTSTVMAVMPAGTTKPCSSPVNAKDVAHRSTAAVVVHSTGPAMAGDVTAPTDERPIKVRAATTICAP